MQSEKNFNQNLGAMIRATRLKLGMSQMDVANKIGVTFQQVQKYESGDSAVSAYRLSQISRALQTSFAARIMDGLPDDDLRVFSTDKIRLILRGLERELLGQNLLPLHGRA